MTPAVGPTDLDVGPDDPGASIAAGRRFTWSRPHRTTVGVGLLAIVLGAVFVIVDLSYNGGKLVPPLDDTYIHLQYGSQIGRGHFLQYNTGDPISTGASSLLYVLILGAAYAIGFQGHWLLPFAVIFGILCLAATASGVCALGRRLIGPEVGLCAGVLVAISGPLLWGASSGMEVGLTAALFVFCGYFFVREAGSGRFVVTSIVAALLAVTRPEGLVFDVFLCGAMLWTIAGTIRRRQVNLGVGLGRAAWTLLPLAFGAGQLLFIKIATGTFSANGVQAKSVFNIRPMRYPTEAVEQTMANFRNLIELFGGLSNRDFAMPGAIIFFVLGIAYLVVSGPRWRSLTIAVGLGIGAVLLATSTLISSQVHHFRYIQPVLPLFLLFMVIGIHGATRVAPTPRGQRVALRGVLATAVIFSLVMLPIWSVRLGRESATIRDTAASIGNWVRGNLPPGATVAVKDVGGITYFGGHRVVDIIGLATDNLAAASNNGIGTLYEALRRMPADQRPDYFVVYDPVVGPSMADLRAAGVLSKPLYVFDVTVPPTDDPRIVPFPTVEVYKADWSLLGTGDRQSAPGQVRDYVNVGDLTNEHAHGYQVRPAHVGIQPYSLVRRVGQVIDSGRQIIGGEEFTTTNLEPGRSLTITSRTDLTGSEASVQVVVNGVPVGLWHRTRATDGWATETFTVPGNLITGPSAHIQLTVPRPLLNPYPEYISFGYWLSQ